MGAKALGLGFADLREGDVVGVGVVQPMLFAVRLAVDDFAAAAARAQRGVGAVRVERALHRH